jgi:hypothetical protein
MQIEDIIKAIERLSELEKEFDELKNRLESLRSVDNKPLLSTRDIRGALQCSTNTAYKIMDEVGKILVNNKNYVIAQEFWDYLSKRKQPGLREIKSQAINYTVGKALS